MDSYPAPRRSPRRPYKTPRLRKETEPERLGHLLPDPVENENPSRD